MDFFKQAANFVQSNKSDESSGTSGGNFDVSDLMSKAEGFLAEKKPEVFAADPEKAAEPVKEEEEIVKKPSEDTEEVPEPAVAKEEIEDQVSEKPPTTEPAEPVKESAEPEKEESSEIPTTADAKPSYSELYGSAQILYSGLRGNLGGETDVDNQKLASAAEDLVQGAESLGLLKPENPYSDYFKKTEGFLHNYSSSDAVDSKKPSPDESA